ncbi:MAG: electron transport complex subunit RsxC, partial [Kangiellaceae bacterium]|nr:electron transport complex subunit RsxC [Kangiellaceae bacterium]
MPANNNKITAKTIQLTMAKFTIPGGINPQEKKTLSNNKAIKRLLPSNHIILPMIEKETPLDNILRVGSQIRKGQILRWPEIEITDDITHSSCNAKISSLNKFDLGHPSELLVDAIKIARVADEPSSISNDARDEASNEGIRLDKLDWTITSSQLLLERIHQAGIVGLGGAAFPTHIKLSTQSKKINTLIVNAMECEPYITCDDRMLREFSDKVLLGSLIAAKILGVDNIKFGIEDNKPEAAQALLASVNQCLSESIQQLAPKYLDNIPKLEIIVAKTKYPSGGEKQIIQLLTGKQVPKGELPSSIGIIVQNVATLYAINEAVSNGLAMLERLVTITGDLVEKPGNYWIEFGTPVSHIIETLNINIAEHASFIFGGPMMGQKLTNVEIPTKKSTNCIIFDTQNDSNENEQLPCIRCSE